MTAAYRTARILLITALILALPAAGCASDPAPTTAAPSVTTTGDTRPVPSTTAPTTGTTKAPTTSPSPAPTTTSATTTVTTEATTLPVPDEPLVYTLVGEESYAYSAADDPDQLGPRPVIDQFEAFFAQMAQNEAFTICQFDVLPDSASFLFRGPNGPLPDDTGNVTTSAAYSWSVPAELVTGDTVSLDATGIREVTVLPEDGPERVRTESGELYFSLFASEAHTFDMDFTWSGDGAVLIEPAFGNALNPPVPEAPHATGQYLMAIPDGPYETLVIEVMMVPFNGTYSLHRLYFYQTGSGS